MTGVAAATPLEMAVAEKVAQGWRVESASAVMVVLVRGERRRLTGGWGILLNVVLTVFTAGAWLVFLAIGWALSWAASGERRLVLTAAADGSVTEHRGRSRRR